MEESEVFDNIVKSKRDAFSAMIDYIASMALLHLDNCMIECMDQDKLGDDNKKQIEFHEAINKIFSNRFNEMGASSREKTRSELGIQ